MTCLEVMQNPQRTGLCSKNGSQLHLAVDSGSNLAIIVLLVSLLLANIVQI